MFGRPESAIPPEDMQSMEPTTKDTDFFTQGIEYLETLIMQIK